MRIFLSHSSSQKPLVREIRKCLPAHLSPWLDEEKLLFGDNIADSLERVIKTETDYVILFIDDQAARSEWVEREILWALEAERRTNRTILLPVAVDEAAFHQLAIPELRSRKYLRLKDFLEASVEGLADSIASELFSLVCRDVDMSRDPKPKSMVSKLQEANSLLGEQAALIQKAVFPHRRLNPISKDTLLTVLNSQGDTPVAPADFDELLRSIIQRNLVPGLLYDGDELYVVEEHASWKAGIALEKKKRIAKRAAGEIINGSKVFLDAGSTSEQVVAIVKRKIQNRAITRITIATTSINIADIISDCCVEMGFDDDFSAVRLFVPGGEVRPATQAVIPLLDEQRSQIWQLADALGGFDISIVGVNGIDSDGGFTTHDNPEALNKIDILKVAEKPLILGDSSKIGIVLEHRFATFEDNVLLICDQDDANERLAEIVRLHPSKLVLV